MKCRLSRKPGSWPEKEIALAFAFRKDALLHIQAHEDEIARLIRSNHFPCKVLLKTADDPILLPIWLDHYTKLFDPRQIIIADNESRHPDVLAIYENLPPGVVTFSYSADKLGFHNNIHNRRQFPGLYAALKASCSYTIFLDTDELLYIVSDQQWSLDPARLEALLEQAQGKAISTTWAHAIHSSTNTFHVGDDTQRLAWDLRWGKPFVPSAFEGAGFRIHNTQFHPGMFDPDLGANFFLLHLIYYSRAQRLNANKRKLIARAAASEQDSLEEIVARDYTGASDPTVPRLVAEIARTLEETWPSAPTPDLHPPWVRFAADGRVQYGSASAARAFAEFRSDFRRFFEDAYRD